MYSEKCYYYFDLALTQGAAMQMVMSQPQIFQNAQGDLLNLMVCEQGDLVFQIKAPVYPTAAIALIKEQYAKGQRVFDLKNICSIINCPDTHRHQVQWVLDCVKEYVY